jgi:hypothetical protein
MSFPRCIALHRQDGHLYALVGSQSLYVAKEAGDWTPPIKVPGPVGFPATREPTTTFDVDSAAFGTPMAWIDYRWQRWTDSYPWANNDLYLGLLMDWRMQIAPIRMTGDSAFVSSLRLHAYRDTVVILWSGRSKVGRTVMGAGCPPQLFRAIAYRGRQP